MAPGEPAPKGGGRYKIGDPYSIDGKRYVPREQPDYDQVGIASWYGEDFHGRRTANGEIYDMTALTAAHPTLPLPVYVKVTNLLTRRSLVVRVNDRGPFRNDRIIDMSWRAAKLLGFDRRGTAPVRVTFLKNAPLDGDDSFERQYLAQQDWWRKRKTRLASASGDRAGSVRGSSKKPPQRISLGASVATSPWRAPALARRRTHPSGKSGIRSAYYVRVGAFGVRANAERIKTRLAPESPVRIEAAQLDRDELYLVKLGPFAELHHAEDALRIARREGLDDAKIIRQ